MATLFLDKTTNGRVKGYNLKTAYNEREYAMAVGGKWDSNIVGWRLPLDVNLDILNSMPTPFVLSIDALEHLSADRKRRRELTQLHSLTDAGTYLRYDQGLTPYQTVGVYFLVQSGSCILADEMGLGKTAQTIRACEELEAQRILVVAKKSLLYNWLAEIDKFSVGGAITRGRDSTRILECSSILNSSDQKIPNTRWVITNYEAAVKHLDALSKQSFDVLIIDEATAIKNRKAQRTKAIHKLAKKIPHKYLLTGTPVHNQVTDLWSLLHTIDPVYYSSYWRFAGRHCELEENGWGGVDILGVKDEEMLAQELAPYMLRRTKELLNLPALSYEDIHLQLNEKQRRIYDDLHDQFLAEVSDGTYVVTPNILTLLTRLRQVVCSPALIGGPDDSAKSNTLVELLEEYCPEHKVLIFTTFAQYVELLRERLKGFNAVSITGKLSATVRENAVKQFQNDPKCHVLIGTTQAMGEGLNLQAADVVIFLNRDWTPAINEQAIARAYRKGQTKPVHVINLVAYDTVDQHIEKLLRNKELNIKPIKTAERLIAQMLGRSA